MGVHHAAEVGYQRAAEQYEQVRPSYPTAALGMLADALGIVPGRHVVDLGAGTGKFTRLLALTGARVTAVEPVPAMREQLAAALPRVNVVPGTAEATNLPGCAADAAVAAQAWHWFDAPLALAEVERLLVPGGGLGLIWNTLDESVPWVAEYSKVYQHWAPEDLPGHRDGRWRDFFDELPGWDKLAEAHLPNPFPTDREGAIGRMLSSSHVATLDPDDQARVRVEVEAVLDLHTETAGDRVEIPYVTDVYWTHHTG